jgi:hypothetical protein
MKLQGSSINKTGSKYSPTPVIYNQALFKMGATNLPVAANFARPILAGSSFTLLMETETCFHFQLSNNRNGYVFLFWQQMDMETKTCVFPFHHSLKLAMETEIKSI